MKFKIFRFKKVNSTNNTAIRIIKNTNSKYILDYILPMNIIILNKYDFTYHNK